MAKEKIRISKTGTTGSGRIALYTNSKEVSDLDPSLVRFIPGNSLSSLFLASESFDEDIYSIDDATVLEIFTNESAETFSNEGSVSEEGSPIFTVPSNADIEVVSNQVVYDSTGQPSVTVVFKIKNSSGVELKGINAKIELL